MKFRITDLLDDLQEVNVDILSCTAASESRIKELTMKKIQRKAEPRRRGRGFVSKLLIAAAIITALAVPVLAASGYLFTDWLEGLDNKQTGYDNSLTAGSQSAHWEVSGWVVNLAAQDVSADALTLVCMEIGTPEKEGTLTAGSSFWLEQWNGTEYVPLSPKTEIPAGDEKAIVSGDILTWHISWADSYGALDSGSYRLGMIFTYTDNVGRTQEQSFYAKFRVFNGDMAPYIDQCKSAFDALHEQDSYHLTYTMYLTDEAYSHIVHEVWKNGDNYLRYTEWIHEDGSVSKHMGDLLRDGIGYTLSWEDNAVLSGIMQWQYADYVTVSYFDLWYTFLSMADSHVGELYVDGTRISIVSSSYFADDFPHHWELAYTFDEQGRIENAQKADLPELYCEESEKVPTWTMEVHNTDPGEIAQVIAAQDVGKPYSFSWAEDQALYPAGAEGVKTAGFVNTNPQTIESAYDALTVAKAEYELVYYSLSKVSYDETADMWKVEFTWTQNNSYQAVYMDAHGITQLTVTQ